jgi:hypothetical protein
MSSLNHQVFTGMKSPMNTGKCSSVEITQSTVAAGLSFLNALSNSLESYSSIAHQL